MCKLVQLNSFGLASIGYFESSIKHAELSYLELILNMDIQLEEKSKSELATFPTSTV